MTRFTTAFALIATTAIAAPAFAETEKTLSTMSSPAHVQLDTRDLGQSRNGVVVGTSGIQQQKPADSYLDQRDLATSIGGSVSVYRFGSRTSDAQPGGRV